MNTTIFNSAGFQELPKGLKQMLLVSEAYFFDEPSSHIPVQAPVQRAEGTPPKMIWTIGCLEVVTRPFSLQLTYPQIMLSQVGGRSFPENPGASALN
jgi:hypothetical protein